VKTGGKVMLYSRRGKSFNSQFRDVANALNYLPDDTVIDGEIVAIDEDVRPSFNLLQNFRLAGTNIQYFAFDILRQKGKELTRLPLSQRGKFSPQSSSRIRMLKSQRHPTDRSRKW
jgi:ATP-dependent DNA ligase